MRSVDQNPGQIRNLCEQPKASRIFALGSVLTGSFRKMSNIDLIIDFQQVAYYRHTDNFLVLKESPEHLLNYSVDTLE